MVGNDDDVKTVDGVVLLQKRPDGIKDVFIILVGRDENGETMFYSRFGIFVCAFDCCCYGIYQQIDNSESA